MTRPPAKEAPAGVSDTEWQSRQQEALRLGISITVEAAYKEERRMFRLACIWFVGGLVSIGLLSFGSFLAGSLTLPQGSLLLRVFEILGGLLLTIGGAFLLISPFAFLFALIAWLMAMRDRRRAMYPLYHPDLQRPPAAPPSSPPGPLP